MKLQGIVPLWALIALIALTQQAPSERCTCQLSHTGKAFPHDKLKTVEGDVSECNSKITKQKAKELEGLLLGLEKRLSQAQRDVSVLEREDDGELYGVLSLYVIENEMTEILQLIDKLNSTTWGHRGLTANKSQQLEELKTELQELEKFDTMQVVKGRLANKRLATDLALCKEGLNTTAAPTQRPPGSCSHGPLLNITGPRVQTAGEYPGSYMYGAWGRDPKPEAGKEKWYWLVIMTSSNRYSNYVRLYSSRHSLIVGKSEPEIMLCKMNMNRFPANRRPFRLDHRGASQVRGNIQIHSSNPTTNTIQGPNVVLYGAALYYNCYNQDAVCRFNLTDKSITTLQLPKGTRYNSKGNFCNLEECYPYTDLDLATDESGVWVIYTTTQDFGNLVLSKVEEGQPLTLGQTWRTSVYKQGVTNAFMACGILYATRYVNRDLEEIFYSFDTATGKERFNVGIFMNKMSPNIQALNYSPVDQMLHAYSDSYMVSYNVLFV